MKRIMLLCFLLLLVACKSKSPNSTAAKSPGKVVEKNIAIVKAEEVDAVKKDRAFSVGERLLESCNTSKFRAFSATEATDKVRLNATREKVSAICKKFNQRNGRFNGINLIDITRNKKTKEYVFFHSQYYIEKHIP